MNSSATELRGSFTPLVTPFRDGLVDLDCYEQLVERQVEGGSDGVVVAGTTGEPSTLTEQERRDLLRVAVSAAAGRIEVVAASGSQSYAESLRLTQDAEATGADAVLIVTPYYIKPPQRGLIEYFTQLGRAVDLPMLMYHIPGRAGVTATLDTLVSIREAAPTFIGMKHASADLSLVSEALHHLGHDFRVFVGLEELSLPMLSVGAAGVMNAVGNVDPRRVASLCHAMLDDHDWGRARDLHYQLLGLNRAVFWDTNPIPIKYMMKRLGLIDVNEHRLPMAPADAKLERRLDELLGTQRW